MSPSFRIGLCAVCLALGCDDPKPGAGGAPTAKPSAAPTPAPSAVEAPTTTSVSMDDNAVTVNGTRIAFDGPNPRSRIATELVGKPKIAGENVPLVAQRNAKAARVAIAVAALKDAKAAGVVVRTQKRDNATGELPVGWVDAPVACSAVAMIAKDVSISVWTVGGVVARRFAKGMAGPDLTLGSDAFRKGASTCDSPMAYVAGDEGIQWGLVFDLALAAKEGGEGGAFRAQKFGLVLDPPVPGRKVTPL